MDIFAGFFKLGSVVLIGAVILGGLAYDKFSTSISSSTPQSTPSPTIITSQSMPVPVTAASQSTPTNTPTRVPTVDMAQATLVFQTVVAGNTRGTLEAAQAQATLDALTAKQRETIGQQTRTSEQWAAQQTRTTQEEVASATRQAVEVALQTESASKARESAQTSATIANVLIVIGTLGTLTGILYGIVSICHLKDRQTAVKARETDILAKEAEARIREAEAKAYDAQRRLLEVQAAVQSKKQERIGQMAVGSLTSSLVPQDGNGDGHGA